MSDPSSLTQPIGKLKTLTQLSTADRTKRKVLSSRTTAEESLTPPTRHTSSKTNAAAGIH